MKLYTKILTSIPSTLSLLTIIDMWTIEFMWKTFPSMDAYHTHLISIFIVSIIAWIYLLKRLWSYKRIAKSTKTTWTLVMIFVFSQVTTLYYIWTKDNQLLEENMRLGQKSEPVIT